MECRRLLANLCFMLNSQHIFDFIRQFLCYQNDFWYDNNRWSRIYKYDPTTHLLGQINTSRESSHRASHTHISHMHKGSWRCIVVEEYSDVRANPQNFGNYIRTFFHRAGTNLERKTYGLRYVIQNIP